jgi:hypothetical protein
MECGDEKQNKRDAPLFLSMPDGTISEGWPPGYKDTPPPPSPRAVELGVDVMLQNEYETIYSRHSRLFEIILFVELFIDALFTFLNVTYRNVSMAEVSRVYSTFSDAELQSLFWGVLYIEVAFCTVYYAAGFVAVASSNTTIFRFYTFLAGFCILTQVLLAYVNTFNLLSFCLHMIGYIYGKFLGNLRRSIDLIPEAMLADP